MFADVNEAAPAFRRSPERTGAIQSGSVDGSARASSSSAPDLYREPNKRRESEATPRSPSSACSSSDALALVLVRRGSEAFAAAVQLILPKWNRRCF